MSFPRTYKKYWPCFKWPKTCIVTASAHSTFNQSIYRIRVKNDRIDFEILTFLPFEQGNSRAAKFKMLLFCFEFTSFRRQKRVEISKSLICCSLPSFPIYPLLLSFNRIYENGTKNDKWDCISYHLYFILTAASLLHSVWFKII